MNTAAESTFRGYRAIQEVTDKMDRLATWLIAFKPGCKEMTLVRKDYDLLKRWPKAASLLNVMASGDDLHYRGFLLKFDKKEPRYEKR